MLRFLLKIRATPKNAKPKLLYDTFLKWVDSGESDIIIDEWNSGIAAFSCSWHTRSSVQKAMVKTATGNTAKWQWCRCMIGRSSFKHPKNKPAKIYLWRFVTIASDADIQHYPKCVFRPLPAESGGESDQHWAELNFATCDGKCHISTECLCFRVTSFRMYCASALSDLQQNASPSCTSSRCFFWSRFQGKKVIV